MKKMLTSAGLVLLGATGIQAQHAAAPQLTRLETSKPWSVAASLRGFYDDNYVTRPSDLERDSYGIEVSPSVGFNWTLPQTYVGLSYVYGAKWYEDRKDDEWDHSHQANLKLSHAFTERYKLDISDTFVIAQEPELFQGGTFLRQEGDNVRNTADATFTAGLTEQLSTVLGYKNSFYDFDNDRLSALLDRMEHLGHISLPYQIVPTTVGILGYQYGVTEYDNDNFLSPGVNSDIRDNTSHYGFVGVDHAFSPQFSASARVGAQFTDYENADEDTVSPYVDANTRWDYMEGSYAVLGVKHQRQATDVANSAVGGLPTLDQEATTVYTSISHEIFKNFTASVLAQYQRAEFEGGAADGDIEQFLLAGVNLTYQFNQYLAAEAGYNFDRLDSDLDDRSFTRNRVYVGVRATY
jgi:hypothetical protein